jgi:hypothetical protein
MKFEMEFGYFGNNKISIETNDFDMIQIFQEFVQFQENYGWAVDYVAVPDDEEFEDEDDTEEELDGAVYTVRGLRPLFSFWLFCFGVRCGDVCGGSWRRVQRTS